MASNDFLYNLKALYWATDGGFSPSCPMKMYHGFMIHKIHEASSSKLNKLVWSIIHVVTGILAYPILGFFAGLDMAVNWLNGHLHRKQQNRESLILKSVFSLVHGVPARCFSAPFQLTSNGSWVMPVLKNFRKYEIRFGPETVIDEFKVKKQQLAEEVDEIVERCINLYTRVYIQSSGSWEHGMEISFFVKDSSLPYCSNPLLPSYEKITYSPNILTL